MTLASNLGVQRGTFVQKGVLDAKLSRAVTACEVYDDADANVTLAQAITQLTTDLPSTHADISAPLQAIRVTKFGNMALGRGVYVRSAFGGSEADDPFAFAQIDGTTVTRAWWSLESGSTTPAGDGSYPSSATMHKIWDDTTNLKRIAPWQREIGVLRIQIRVRLAVSGVSAVLPYLNTLNDNPFTISGKSFPPKTLWFPNFTQTAVLFDNASGEFNMTYVFWYRPDTWVFQTLRDSLIDLDFYQAVPQSADFPDEHTAVTWVASQFPTS